MYGYIYETICNINNKKYIGQHKGEFDSNYLGSGIAITRAINKYGKSNFSVNLIEYAETREQLNALEKYYIESNNAVISEEYYNIAYGGEGGDTYTDTNRIMKGHPHSSTWRNNISKGNKGKRLGLVESEDIRNKKSKSHKNLIRVTKDNKGTWIRPDQLEEYLNKGYIKGGVSVNSGDSHFMRKNIGIYCWVNNGYNDFRILKSELDLYLNNGYIKGRVFKPRKNVQRLSKG